jgi:hypothetical protein
MFGLIVDDFPIASERVPDAGLVGSSSIYALAHKPRCIAHALRPR